MVLQQGQLGTWSEFLPQKWLREAWTAWQEMLPQQRPVQKLLPVEGPAQMLLTQLQRKAPQRLHLLETFPSPVEGPSS